MDQRRPLMAMLKQLLEDMYVIQQQGAGYYTCVPFARRYNKLLDQARKIVRDDNGLIETFDDIEQEDPVDPADKLKVIQSIRVEINQLLSLLSSEGDVPKE